MASALYALVNPARFTRQANGHFRYDDDTHYCTRCGDGLDNRDCHNLCVDCRIATNHLADCR